MSPRGTGHKRRELRRIAVLALAGISLSLMPVVLARASNTTTQNAITWLKMQQKPDGGFEVAGFAGFETPDAVLAIAENAQTGSSWDAVAARNAVNGVTKNGKSGLTYLGTYAQGNISPGQAANLIYLVAKPLGLDPTNFNPDGDGTTVNLVTKLGNGNPNGSFGTFNETLRAALAKYLVTGSVPMQTINFIRSAQQANGGWFYTGDPTDSRWDVDTTGAAVEALIASGATSSDTAIRNALTFLASPSRQHANGSWQNAFAQEDPNTTSSAIRAITAVGYDSASSCWRDVVDPSQLGHQYTSPDSFLRNSQQGDGHIASPNDGATVNTFATTQTVSALLRQWVPVRRITGLNCVPPSPPTTVKVGGLQTDRRDAYWFMHGDGSYASEVAGVGNLDGGALRLNSAIVSVAMTHSGFGAVAVGGDGGIFAFGTAQYRGAIPFRSHIAAIANTLDDAGYCVVSTEGSGANVGVAGHYGDLSSTRLNKPIVGIATTPDGLGYWLVASDGGIFAFGDAVFSGSMGAIPLNQPIIDMARSSSGGYWMFARDGGVFSFGGAPFLGAPLGIGTFVTAAG